MKRFIAIDAIKIAENRQRKEFNQAELNELQESIQNNGLIHAPVLRIEGDHYYLVAGERRLRAIRDLYECGGTFSYDNEEVIPGLVPYTFLGDLSPLEAAEVELEENIRRSDLTWVERAAAVAKLMEFRTMQASASGVAPPTVADLSEEVRGSRVGSNQDNTRKELILSRHLNDPDISAAKSIKEAFTILKRKEVAERNQALAVSVGATFTHNVHKVFNADSFDWLASAPANTFDIILTDPPYGMNADAFGNSGKAGEYTEHAYEDSADFALECYMLLAKEGYRVTKENAHLYAFCDIDLFTTIKSVFADAGWKVFRTPLVWFKPTAFRAPWPEQGPQRKYEIIFYAVKGDRKVNKLFGDVLTYSTDDNLGHQAQKPVALLIDLLSRSYRPGDKVLDPFCGSGSIFPAGHELKCEVTGVEVNSQHYGLALQRIKSLEIEPTLKGLL